MADKKVSELTTEEKMLLGMEEIVRHLNNEEAIEPWLMCGVPDGADIDEILEMANDESTFRYCASLFLGIMSHKTAYEDGIFIPNKKLITNTSRKEENNL